jgi:hypothetical protein
MKALDNARAHLTKAQFKGRYLPDTHGTDRQADNHAEAVAELKAAGPAGRESGICQGG